MPTSSALNLAQLAARLDGKGRPRIAGTPLLGQNRIVRLTGSRDGRE